MAPGTSLPIEPEDITSFGRCVSCLRSAFHETYENEVTTSDDDFATAGATTANRAEVTLSNTRIRTKAGAAVEHQHEESEEVSRGDAEGTLIITTFGRIA